MRIAHVTNGLDAQGRFGGVQVVVLDLARALVARGHRCIVVSGRTATVADARRIAGLPLISARIRTPLPALGRGGQLAPPLLAAAAPVLAGADIVHIHFSRDVTSLTAALLARALRRPVVLQTHGMLDAPGNPVARLLDRTVVPVAVRAARAILVLADDEHATVAAFAPRVEPERFPNGTAVPAVVTPLRDRAPEVLFLARLHPRKGALEFTRAALTAAARRPEAVFVIAGPDEGDLPAVRAEIAAAGLEARFRLPGGIPHQEALDALGRCRLFVLPARREPFGMTVIEAMVRGTPVVLHESAELGPDVREHGLGWTFQDEADLAAVLVAATGDLEELERRGAAARAYASRTFGIDAVTDRLEAVYRRVAAAPTRVLVAGAHADDSVSMHRATDDIARGYRAAGVRAAVVRPSSSLSGRVPGPLRKPAKYLEVLVLFPLSLARRGRRADVLHVADHSNAPWLLMPGLPAHRIVTVHDLVAQRAARRELREHVPRWSGRVYQRLIAAGLRRASVFYPVSEATRADTSRLFPAVRSRLLANAVDGGQADAEGEPGDDVAGEYLLLVSTAGWRKQRATAVRVWAGLRGAAGAPLHLRVVGPPLDDGEWAESGVPSALRDEVVVEEQVSEARLRHLYRSALALLQLSRYEGFGWPIVEANAAGTPAVMRPDSVFQEVGGEAGVFLGPLDQEDWPAVLARLREPGLPDRARSNAARFTRDRFERTLVAHLHAELVGDAS